MPTALHNDPTPPEKGQRERERVVTLTAQVTVWSRGKDRLVRPLVQIPMLPVSSGRPEERTQCPDLGVKGRGRRQCGTAMSVWDSSVSVGRQYQCGTAVLVSIKHAATAKRPGAGHVHLNTPHPEHPTP